MFDLNSMLDLAITNYQIQECLVSLAKGDINIEVQGDITIVRVYDLKIKAEIMDNQVVRLYRLEGAVAKIWDATCQAEMIQEIQDLKAIKEGKCLLVAAGYNQALARAHMNLVEMGHMLTKFVLGMN